MDLKIFQLLESINGRLSHIEKNIARMDEKLDYSITLQRSHLIRIKNGHEIDDSMILMGKPYNDLPPQRAFQIFNDNDMDFLLLDVTSEHFAPSERLKGAIKIPLEELQERVSEIISKTIPILVISERGIRSIQACEMLVKHGYFNLNNISGGYEFWPGKRGSRHVSSLD
jgi:rhodanese-related sulfurtransferase